MGEGGGGVARKYFVYAGAPAWAREKSAEAIQIYTRPRRNILTPGQCRTGTGGFQDG